MYNRAELAGGGTFISGMLGSLSGWIDPVKNPSNAYLNLAAPYDVCNKMLEPFMSPEMTYSCPIWNEPPQGDGESLESAQLRKLRHINRAAGIQPTEHILEIGTGWGTFAIEAARTTGCTVTSVTSSKDEQATAEDRVAAEGLSHRIKVLLCDYREMAVPGELYDKLCLRK